MMIRYDALYTLATLFGAPVFAFNLLRSGHWRTDWRGRFGHHDPLPQDARPTVLVHGVSVGEVSAAREMIALLGADVPAGVPDGVPPQLRIVISSTTDTGLARAQALFGIDHTVVRFPLDFSWMVRRFLDSIRPSLVVLVELEVWPNLLLECERRGIPTCVVNGRLSESSFRIYGPLRRFVRPMFGMLSAVGAQTGEYASRLTELGVPPERVQITDTMKWDNVDLGTSVEGSDRLAAALGIDPTRPLVVAGSTGPGEEQMLLNARPPGVQLILVPRKPERFDEVAGLAPGIVRRTERPDGTPPGEAGDVFLLDTMGELEKAYALADVVVVGRSLVPMGGSDPIPPAALGRPTVIGPHYRNFTHVVDNLAAAGGIIVSDDPMGTVTELLEDPDRGRAMAERARAVIQGRQGASRKSAELVRALLPSRAGTGTA